VTARTRAGAVAVSLGLSLALILGGQSLADAAAPSVPNGALTGAAVGRAGFAYLTGLRKFAAALLWNRLDPQMHEYYGGHAGLGRMVFMLPNIKVITMLDPQFVEGYYVAPEILIDSGLLPGSPPQLSAERLKAGLDLAREGAANNPNSGILLESCAELLWTRGKDLKAAVPYAERAMDPGVVWRTDEEEWDAMAVLGDIFAKSGDTARAAQARAVQAAIDANPNATKNAADGD
jgi:hypothetical protein